jgi:hypothetical protein
VGGDLGNCDTPGTADSTCFTTTETLANGGGTITVLHELYAACPGVEGEACYSWNVQSTGAALGSSPSGIEVTDVFFNTSCAQSGCWQITADLTTGYYNVVRAGVVRGFNSLYIPRAVASDQLSYDWTYTTTEYETFEPANFPCKVSDGSSTTVVNEDTACCLTYGAGVFAEYRVTGAFTTAVNTLTSTGANCNVDLGDLVTDDRTLWAEGQQFDGMTDSPGVYMVTANDEYVGRYTITIQLDEVELRKNAGLLTGTVGVEHTVDTFLGWAHFKAVTQDSDVTNKILDSLATQTAIHLEKTNFFTVSTHGTNDYTFLEYVNLRLVAIYKEDTDFSDGTGETTSDFIRTDSTKQAQYVQVTFTLGSQYKVKDGPEAEPLIPLDSVRTRKGTFADDSAMQHSCDAWGELVDEAGESEFETWLAQDCAPAASMCVSPSAVPDQFVSFNIPIGVGDSGSLTTVLGDYIGAGADDLSDNIFVHMVIAAEDENCASPTAKSCIMRTTLSASIPIVAGGQNIFCDGLTAKTDLRDVADVDIVVGTAANGVELSRLMIKVNVTDSALNPESMRTEINSDSIEAGVMTLVIKGNDEYFLTNTGRNDVSLELEDVITIHIMGACTENGACTDAASCECTVNKVEKLITEDQDDNTDTNGLDIDGYFLNGAFELTIDRASLRAHLEPSAALTAICPFNPVRPAGNVPIGETCVTRRDVRYRGYPYRTGSVSTALEICAGTGDCTDDTTSTEAKFFTSFLGNSDYARNTAIGHIGAIDAEYDLNGRYKRAFMINPGYEWTPTQTGGAAIFSVSQKLFMFALITLDEGIAQNPGASAPSSSYPNRRRMLLSSVDDNLKDAQSGLGGAAVEFQTSPAQMLASAYEVPQDKVATFKVVMQLTEQEVCMADSQLAATVRENLADMVKDVASGHKTVQVLTMKVNKAGFECRRNLRGLKATFTDATVEVTMAVVFNEGSTAQFSKKKLEGKNGIVSVDTEDVSPKVTMVDDTNWTPEVEKKSSSTNIGLIVGIVVGVLAAIALLAVGAFFFMKRSSEPQVVEAVQTINVEDLKSQLATEI